MKAEIRGYKGALLDLEGITVSKSGFDKPRVAYYRVRLLDGNERATIDLSNVSPEEIKITESKLIEKLLEDKKQLSEELRYDITKREARLQLQLVDKYLKFLEGEDNE